MVMWMCVEVRWGCGLRGNHGNVDVCMMRIRYIIYIYVGHGG